ncbi:MAG: hypothetical protein AB7O45_07515 [Alphaproteobacteria bacterium]
MATAYLDLDLGAALADVTAPAGAEVINDTGVTRLRWLFDGTADEFIHWQFRMPGDYASAPVLKLLFAMASATTGNIVAQAQVMAVTPGDAAAVDTGSLDSANASSATAVPATAGHMKEVSITLTNADSLAAGDLVDLKVGRDPDNASDTASGDLELYAATLEYTTS